MGPLPDGRAPLSPVARVLIAAEVLVTYAGMRRRVRREPFSRLSEQLAPEPGAAQPDRTTHDQAVRLARAVRAVVGRLPTDSRCLIQSLVLSAMLQRRAVPAALVIGVRADGGAEFAAHAWVEHAGVAVLPSGTFSDGRLIEVGLRGRSAG